MIETQIYVCQKENVFKGSNLAHLPMPSLSLDLYSQETNTFQLYFSEWLKERPPEMRTIKYKNDSPRVRNTISYSEKLRKEKRASLFGMPTVDLHEGQGMGSVGA